MSYNETEARYFYWHCLTAAKVLSELGLNTATRVHLNNAIRMATLNAVGKNGIVYASSTAFDHISKQTGANRTRGLIREHVVPISEISKRIVEAWRSNHSPTWRELTQLLTNADFKNWSVIDSDDFLDSDAPLSAIAAAIIRQRTALAWVTSTDNALLRARGLGKSMPKGCENEVFSRYTECQIKVVKLS